MSDEVLNVQTSPPDLANLVLEDTVERIYAGNTFAEKWCGLFLIRGENVVLLGEIVPPLSLSYLSLTLIIDRRIWIKKMTFHYARLITSSSMITIDKTSLRRSRGRK
jgi:LSM domain